jgi:sugar phosphate isomerase/epimerase
MPANQLHRRLALSQSMLDNITMAADLDMACESGAHAVALCAGMVRNTGAAETVRLLRERGLGVTSIHLSLKLLEMSEVEADAALRDSLYLAAAVGASVAPLSAGSSGGLKAAEADHAYLKRLERVTSLSKELNVTMGIEPLHPFLHAAGYIHSIRHAARIASRIENCGIVFDAVHLYWDAELEDDMRANGDKLCLVQLADLDGYALAQRRWARTCLGQGVVPLVDLMRMVDVAGYCGPYESELLIKLPHDACVEAARSARLWFEQIWQYGVC